MQGNVRETRWTSDKWPQNEDQLQGIVRGTESPHTGWRSEYWINYRENNITQINDRENSKDPGNVGSNHKILGEFGEMMILIIIADD